MTFQRIFNFLPCLRCVTFNRTFNTFDRLHKSQLEKLKSLNKRFFNEESIFNLNTNVSKDVLLYKSSSDKTYKMISVFSIVQFGFWITVADSYNVLLNKEPDNNENHQPISWVDKIKSRGKIATLGIPIACLCMGTTLIAICSVYTMKSVKMLVLCKGGDNLSITSFGFFNRNITTTIPLETVSCAVGRNSSGQNIPLKVKGKWFHYTLDKNGKIYNPKLFDYTAGLSRNV
uniref:Transmembrane protein n=1 Tax=Schizaphis graminum TaxID=13262 RepID=A0A2S2NCS7_SCHGA